MCHKCPDKHNKCKNPCDSHKKHCKPEKCLEILTIVSKDSKIQASPNCMLIKDQEGIDLTQFPQYNYLGFNFEPCIAVNPKDKNNIIGYTAVQLGGSRNIECSVFYTLDGGKTWSTVTLNLGRCMKPTLEGSITDIGSGGDPWVTFDKDGFAYVSYLAFDRVINPETGSPTGPPINSSVLILKSTDKGRSWDAPVRVNYAEGFNPPAIGDKPGVFGNLKTNGLYLTYHDQVSVTTIHRSIDGGNFFEDPTVLQYLDTPYSPYFIWGSNIVNLRDGTVILAVRNSIFDTELDIGFGPGNNEQIYINRSTDNGATFGPTITALPDSRGTVAYDAPNGYIVRDAVLWVDIAVNKCNDYLYATVQDSRFNPNSVPDGFEFLGAGSVIIMSTDGGFTWSSPVPINPTTTEFQAYMPSVSVAKNGTVGVFYYTDRNHNYEGDDGSEILETDVYVSLFDKNLTYLGEKHVTQFNLRKAPVLPAFGFNAYYIGDYSKSQSVHNDFASLLPIANSDGSGGFPLPGAPGEYTELSETQFSKFARVSSKCSYAQSKNITTTNKSLSKRLNKASVTFTPPANWPITSEEIEAVRKSRRR